jgi:uncharacterized membrane protein YozB (DUF420 family)
MLGGMPKKVWVMFAVAVVVGAVITAPYLLLDMDSSRVEVSGPGHFYLLVAHIFTAFVALVLGPLQFIPAIRRRRKVHRIIGRTYLFAGVLPSGLLAIPVAVLSGRLITQVGLIIPASLWLVTAFLAFRAARQRDFAAHRAWMMRNYALTFLAVTARALVPLMLLTQLPISDPSQIQETVDKLIPLGQSSAWILNLLIAEVIIRRSRAVKPVLAR